MSAQHAITSDYLFVYGTLRLGSEHPLALRLRREAFYLDLGRVCGELYLVDEYPGLVVREDSSAMVRGDLFRLPAAENLLLCLDAYEGCGIDTTEPQEYRRHAVEVFPDQGGSRIAWSYLYNWPTAGLPRIRSGDFFRPNR